MHRLGHSSPNRERVRLPRLPIQVAKENESAPAPATTARAARASLTSSALNRVADRCKGRVSLVFQPQRGGGEQQIVHQARRYYKAMGINRPDPENTAESWLLHSGRAQHLKVAGQDLSM